MKANLILEKSQSLHNDQKGRRQAMTNTFIRLGTRPEQYTPHTHCQYGKIKHCQLCGAALEYYFPLTHVDDENFNKDKSLFVGGDCLYNFTELYMPTIAEQILNSIEKAMTDAKGKKFKETFPTIFEDFKKLKETIFNLDRQFAYHPGRGLLRYKNFFTNYRHLFRQEYLSKPKVEEFYKFKKEVENTWLKKLTEHTKISISKKTIKESKDKFYREYEKNYLTVYSRPLDLNSRILSPFEKECFLEKFKENQKVALKKVKPFAKEIQSDASFYLYLLKQKNMPNPYFLHLIYNFYPIKEYYKVNMKKEVGFNNFKKTPKDFKKVLELLPFGKKEILESLNEN